MCVIDVCYICMLYMYRCVLYMYRCCIDVYRCTKLLVIYGLILYSNKVTIAYVYIYSIQYCIDR